LAVEWTSHIAINSELFKDSYVDGRIILKCIPHKIMCGLEELIDFHFD
jgi:hypothetical protein